jgi:hypothetical protein
MVKASKTKIDPVDVLPPWVIDPDVKDFLESEGIELLILLDEKFKRGSRSMPLIILRGMLHPTQYYLPINRRACL